jgi:hypothetical protein
MKDLCITCENCYEWTEYSGIFFDCKKECLPAETSNCGVVLCNNYEKRCFDFNIEDE